MQTAAETNLESEVRKVMGERLLTFALALDVVRDTNPTIYRAAMDARSACPLASDTEPVTRSTRLASATNTGGNASEGELIRTVQALASARKVPFALALRAVETENPTLYRSAMAARAARFNQGEGRTGA